MKELNKCVLVKGNYSPAHLEHDGRTIFGYLQIEQTANNKLEVYNTYNQNLSDISKFNILCADTLPSKVPTEQNQVYIRTIPDINFQWFNSNDTKIGEFKYKNLDFIGNDFARDFIDVIKAKKYKFWDVVQLYDTDISWEGSYENPYFYLTPEFLFRDLSCEDFNLRTDLIRNQYCSFCQTGKQKSGSWIEMSEEGNNIRVDCSTDAYDYINSNNSSFTLRWVRKIPYVYNLDAVALSISPQKFKAIADGGIIQAIVKTSYYRL